ncbi:MAG: ankyrin repeat domain-containing protein [Saprospiraceae bacterium]
MGIEFEKQNELDSELFQAFAEQDSDLAKIADLITAGANIDAENEEGDTILMLACDACQTEEDLDKVKLILELGADINYEKDGLNCLFDAYRTWVPELVELLLRSGADPNCYSTNGDGALLDWVANDLWMYKDKNMAQGGPLTKIYQMLKEFDAKTSRELAEIKGP